MALGAALMMLAALSVSSDSGRPTDSSTPSVDVETLPSPQHAVRPPAPEPFESYPTAAAGACGYWTATYAEIAKRHGELRNCEAIDAQRSAWVITTLGTTGTHGVIAV
ncbi:MAG TPA: hypothetical protein VI172_04595, partial [Candidatus Dormibacteraeota bacterium]